MKPATFLANFSSIANSTDGIKLLRDLVHHFAITGALSNHQVDDSDSSLIGADSLEQKERYYEENSVRQSKRKHSEINQSELQVPNSWTTLPAGDVVHLINGRAFKSSEWKSSGLPIIRIQNLNNPEKTFNYFQGDYDEKHLVRKGSMLLSWSGTPGTSFGAFIWNKGDAVLNQHIFKVIIYSELIDKEYLRMTINACLDALIGSARGGVGLKHVTKGQIEALQIPLPCIEEQKRIVRKVDELMKLCDKLERQQQERSKLFPLLSHANHTRLAATPSPTNLAAIFTDPPSILPDDMRKTILSLAITGALSKRETSDSAPDRIAMDSVRLKELYFKKNNVRQSRRKHTKVTQPELQVPQNWVTLPAGDVVHLINGRAFKSSEWKSSGLPIIRIQNLNNPEKPFNYFQGNVAEKHKVRKGDMLLSWSGTPGTSFGAFIWNKGEAVLNQHIFKVVIYSELVDKEYLRMTINACLDTLIGSARGGVGLKHVTKGQIEALQIPLPSVEEQRRIVRKVDELMALCSKLEEVQKESVDAAKNFSESIVAETKGKNIVLESKMKTPKMKLMTSLFALDAPDSSDTSTLVKIMSKEVRAWTAKELWEKSGLEIGLFYSKLKIEIDNGWISEPEKGYMEEVEAR